MDSTRGPRSVSLTTAEVIGILDRVVEEFVGHSAYDRQVGARRFAHRMVRFVVSEIERASGGALQSRPRIDSPPVWPWA